MGWIKLFKIIISIIVSNFFMAFILLYAFLIYDIWATIYPISGTRLFSIPESVFFTMILISLVGVFIFFLAKALIFIWKKGKVIAQNVGKIVYRIVDNKTGEITGNYSKAYHNEYDFKSASDARNANCHGMFKNRERYRIVKYKVIETLINDDVIK